MAAFGSPGAQIRISMGRWKGGRLQLVSGWLEITFGGLSGFWIRTVWEHGRRFMTSLRVAHQQMLDAPLL